MTFEDRVRALEHLDCSSRQSRFLVNVALNGGYCLRRQYLAFAGVKYGRTVRDFLDGLVADCLAERLTFRAGRGHVYHLYAKSIYRALGEENNRNRRKVGRERVARKLMALDVVLMDQTMEWFPTERDKVALFTSRYRVPLEALPQRRYESCDPGQRSTTRYFVHKLPVGVLRGDPCFVYLATDLNEDAFKQFLLDHASLFARLPSWVVAIVRPPHLPEWNRWHDIFKHFLAPRITPETIRPSDVRWFFEIRQVLDRGHRDMISIEQDARRFCRLHSELATPEYEALYAEWVRRGPGALAELEAAAAASVNGFSAGRGHLLIRKLNHDYRYFDDLAGARK